MRRTRRVGATLFMAALLAVSAAVPAGAARVTWFDLDFSGIDWSLIFPPPAPPPPQPCTEHIGGGIYAPCGQCDTSYQDGICRGVCNPPCPPPPPPTTTTTTTVPAATLTPATQNVTGTAGSVIFPTAAYATANFSGTVTYSVTSGTLPAGLSLNTANGVVSGTPAGATSTSVTVRATGSTTGNATATITFVIAPRPEPDAEQPRDLSPS